MTTTWTNAPPAGAPIAALTSPALVGSWREADVTSAVTGNGELSFYIMTSSADGVWYKSKEASGNPPTLKLTWSVADAATPVSPTSTPSPSATGMATSAPTSTTTPTATPTAPSLPGWQPAPPIEAAFYYPWFPSAWTQSGIYPYSRYEPTLGYYSLYDNAVIDQHITWATQAHLEAMIASWWGQGHHTDTKFGQILSRSERPDSPNPDLRWTMYYEAEGYGNPTATTILSDLNYLAANYFNHPGYLRVNGKPVVFVYGGNETCEMADRWAQAKNLFGGNVYIVLKVFSGWRLCASQPDSWHQYGPSTPYHEHLPHSVNVSPGFWHIQEATPRLVRDSARFEADIQRMMATQTTWHLVTSWNEWGEGTGIEPTVQFGNTYLDILCRNLPGTTACSADPPPTPSPSPVPTPTGATPTPDGSAAVLVGAGDVAECNDPGDEATSALLDNISGTVFIPGDLAYPDGSAADFVNCYDPSWGRHKERTKPVPGNHEYNSSGAAPYFQYFGAIAGDPTKGYYAYNLGSWRVYALNSNCSKISCSAEDTWLRADVAANPKQCTIAYWHHPVLTAGPHSNNEGGNLNLWRTLYDLNVDLVITGHDHNYQRYARLNRDANGVDPNGIRQIVVGTGGKGLTSMSRQSSTPGLEVWMDASSANALGLLKLTLSSGGYRWQFVPVTGKTWTDSGSDACR